MVKGKERKGENSNGEESKSTKSRTLRCKELHSLWVSWKGPISNNPKSVKSLAANIKQFAWVPFIKAWISPKKVRAARPMALFPFSSFTSPWPKYERNLFGKCSTESLRSLLRIPDSLGCKFLKSDNSKRNDKLFFLPPKRPSHLFELEFDVLNSTLISLCNTWEVSFRTSKKSQGISLTITWLIFGSNKHKGVSFSPSSLGVPSGKCSLGSKTVFFALSSVVRVGSRESSNVCWAMGSGTGLGVEFGCCLVRSGVTFEVASLRKTQMKNKQRFIGQREKKTSTQLVAHLNTLQYVQNHCRTSSFAVR